MPTFVHRSEMPAPPAELFAWHARPGALERLLPPDGSVRVLEASGGIEPGSRVVLRLGRGPARLRWVAVHGDTVEGQEFSDAQLRGPFRRWEHVHRCLPSEAGSALEDRVEWDLPLGAFGNTLAGRVVRSGLEAMFAARHERTRVDLERHGAVRHRGPQRIIVSGGSGLIGSALIPFLTTGGHRVDRLIRGTPGAREIPWDPAGAVLDTAALEGADAVVHLSGSPIATGRWTAARKRAIRDSRIGSTRLLCESLARLSRRPRVLICASAIGFYGDRGDPLLDENSAAGEGFLAEVCREWEAAAQPARDAGCRVVSLRIGLVLSASGGVLRTLLPQFRLCLGGPVGGGRQYMSWIALDDLVGAIHHLIFADDVEGPVNGTAPFPVRNAVFGGVLGKVLGRPSSLPLPGLAVRAALGEMGRELLLGGARVLPARLEESGFSFLTPTLEGALRSELRRPDPWREPDSA